ncbi:TetR/AcrR family transcriptional regulator [Paenibacillus sp. UASWS1643]|uniref:TetR/AcrR family transcriptional regulator n=1 Tax=Paenibacillus sp. UASWS1643 TaxID=2580422 RepID=UPI001238EC75|nr:TetR/AcrR family transcriptional regulator [Paenibacillus sp. UASWS1643]KAA8745378.1 TetR/AcrR family transcriptional regulator [Paenibacillus sp. UASWS1643]
MDKRILKTKKNLYLSIEILLKNSLFEQSTVSEICKLAKVNRSTFYIHYVDKNDLFNDYTEHLITKVEKDLFPYQKKIERTGLLPSYEKLLMHVQLHDYYYRFIFSPNVPMRFYYQYSKHVQTMIEELIMLDPSKHINSNLYYAFQRSAYLGVVMEWVAQDFSISVKEVDNQLQLILNLGFSSDHMLKSL